MLCQRREASGKPSPGEMVLIAELLLWLPELKSKLEQRTGPGDPGGEALAASTPNPCSEHPTGFQL